MKISKRRASSPDYNKDISVYDFKDDVPDSPPGSPSLSPSAKPMTGLTKAFGNAKNARRFSGNRSPSFSPPHMSPGYHSKRRISTTNQQGIDNRAIHYFITMLSYYSAFASFLNINLFGCYQNSFILICLSKKKISVVMDFLN